MRHLLKTAAIIGGLSLTFSGVAHAGNCGGMGQGPECQTEVIIHPGMAPSVAPMHVYSSLPMGHLRTVDYLATPSVNVTRIHGMGPTAGLSDAPTAFTDGCLAQSTHYCREGGQQTATPAPVAAPAPMMARPAPVAMPAERVVHVGGGYDPSKFTPRTYGSLELVPGIAHVPTSIVDRSHENAQAVLNSGRTVPQPVVSGGIAPHPSMVAGQHRSGMMMGQPGRIQPVMSQPMMPRPMMHRPMMMGQQIGVRSEMRTMAPEAGVNVYAGGMSGDGTYWEKVSGPTKFGSTQATQVICKRQAPQVRVDRPVYGVPTPVPTPVATVCAPAHAPMHGGMRGGSSRYGR